MAAALEQDDLWQQYQKYQQQQQQQQQPASWRLRALPELQHAAGPFSLRCLFLHDTSSSDAAAILASSACSGLRSLELDEIRDDGSLLLLAALTALTCLSFSNYHGGVPFWDGTPPSLRELVLGRIEYPVPGYDIEQGMALLSCLRGLESLMLTHIIFTPDVLSQLTRLTEVTLQDNAVFNVPGLPPSLRSLSVVFDEPELDERDCEHVAQGLARLTGLTKLYIDGLPLPAAPLPRLTSLHVCSPDAAKARAFAKSCRRAGAPLKHVYIQCNSV